MSIDTSSSTPNAQTKRLLKDLESYYKNPLSFIQNLQYSVDKEGFNQLHGILIGPEHSSYENDTETGHACHDELISSWKPQISISTILSKIYSLLQQPDYNKYYGEQIVPDKDPETARQWTEKYAKPV
ncbi:unnamed protein product [Adineta steineri]|uniref:UBC core domain-containing protein n=1 Tax=Adineta steineri TaxID=433720 RepID=A0A818PLP3_9BILA|nr:unnamed protein product [Adineta steineri]CAF3623129.1 unnamed protein product [Adineta steineri]